MSSEHSSSGNSKLLESVNALAADSARLLAQLNDEEFCRRLTEVVFSMDVLPV